MPVNATVEWESRRPLGNHWEDRARLTITDVGNGAIILESRMSNIDQVRIIGTAQQRRNARAVKNSNDGTLDSQPGYIHIQEGELGVGNEILLEIKGV